jgi:hypothetical protein
MCDIPFDRSIPQLSNGIRHVMPSTDRMLELTAKHRWLSRLTAGCVFQWIKKTHIRESEKRDASFLDRAKDARWVGQLGDSSS